ncbi:WD40 repeat-like-containing domain protein [Niveomyces insectorum RCEF 264]|uniref:WD40 repeat-like-containing domain protein n=1 Tax=Niveomyces insectorum RCEF 264 TaxID=1081102 RepID=A0A167P3G9_9HYPO|nr:WD40 repeat-like-containing domain protein [Niveomyces insectorum RCEF 264]
MFQLALAAPNDSLKLFIDDMMRNTPWDDEKLKSKITEDLLNKSQGSFLWLSLVLRDLVTCNTTEEVLETLEVIPPELSALYARQELLVARDLRPSDAPLVKSLLSWAACSERELHEEDLKEALKPKFPLLNVRHTLSRLCGDFVAVDRKGNISMAHHTANEFLTTAATSMLRVDTQEAHALILERCLTMLTSPRFKLRLKSHGCTGLLRYCCLSWPYHMARSDLVPKEENYVRQVFDLFGSPAVLAWIEAVAITGQISVLASASRALTQVTAIVRQTTAREDSVSHHSENIERLSSWATALVRIAGKFGTHLLQCPGSVYSLLPLFCPPDSVIARQFASTGPYAPKVTGISSPAWDDCLAKLTLSPNQRPEAIYCLDGFLGILTSDKCVNLYDTLSFEELRTFRHEETIATAQFSQGGNLLVTCGIRTMKVWDTATGRVLHRYSNPPGPGSRGLRAASVAFSRDTSEIIAFSLDSSIHRRKLSEEGDWVRVDFQGQDESTVARGRGSPFCSAFSPDGSKIALAYRAALTSVRDTETGSLIGLCVARDGYKITRNANTDHPLKLTWNPVTEHVVGIFLNGSVFKWDPSEPEAVEMDDRGILATEIACSADGRLIVTSHRDGSLKVFDFENFALLFSLSSMVRPSAMAFSPDGRRIYDLRQSVCSVWQPDALIRITEQDEHNGEASALCCGSSITGFSASEATAVMLQPVSVVAADGTSTAYAFGNDGGVVRYFPADSDQGVDLSCGLLGVRSLSFSLDGKSLTAGTLDNKVVVSKITPNGQLDGNSAFRLEALGAIRQTVLDARGEFLLTHDDESCYWMPHPNKRGFISVRPSSISYHDPGPDNETEKNPDLPGSMIERRWDIDWQRLDSVDWSNVAPTSSRRLQSIHRDDDLVVHRVFMTPDHKGMFLQLSGPGQIPGRREIRFTLLDTSFLLSSSMTDADPPSNRLQPRFLPKAILDTIEIPLGFLFDSHDPSRRGFRKGVDQAADVTLAFIDKDFWNAMILR